MLNSLSPIVLKKAKLRLLLSHHFLKLFFDIKNFNVVLPFQ